MKELKIYDIKFSGLKNGNHQYRFHLDKNFFKHFNYDEFDTCDIDVLIDFNKHENLLEFTIHSNGSINVPCDISGDPFDQPVEADFDFLVKFGDEFNDDREDLIIIPYHSHTFNIAQQIYETVVLSIPNKRIHPDILSGKTMAKNARYIVNYEDEPTEAKNETEEIDPRWAALKKILTDKNL